MKVDEFIHYLFSFCAVTDVLLLALFDNLSAHYWQFVLYAVFFIFTILL
jgi:hypothetical protein